MKGAVPIGYRCEERGATLCVHPANRLSRALLLLFLLACVGLPLLLVGEPVEVGGPTCRLRCWH